MPNGLLSRLLNPRCGSMQCRECLSVTRRQVSRPRIEGLRTAKCVGQIPTNEGGTTVPRPLRMWGLFVFIRAEKVVVVWATVGGANSSSIHKTGVIRMQSNYLERVLTGDRTTGKLHLGHYVGSVKNRIEMQQKYDTFILLADVQALTTHFEAPHEMGKHLRQIALDYLSVGIDPEKATIFVQSLVPEIAELTMFYSMFVTVNSLRHNPTVKSEAQERGYNQLYYGFLGYPVSQAADITFCKATLVPVGDDQLPHIEQTRRIVRRFNELYAPVLVEPKAVMGEVPRLVGLDGKSKMSKSLGNAIMLDSTAEEVREKIQVAVTDPARVRKSDPGHPEACPVFTYHQAFAPNTSEEIAVECKSASIGCVECKQRIAGRINELLEPMRERRSLYEANPSQIDDILLAGTDRARGIAKTTMREVREAMGIHYHLD
jgi:tryptophanyl-tRNA synthetase